jgi:predicted nucleic-acid-binding Zn-ribbon protein
MATQQKLPTCVCGNTQFEEKQTSLPIVEKAGITTGSDQRDFWLRICNQCGQATLWTERSK